jgi:hypothetical protein
MTDAANAQLPVLYSKPIPVDRVAHAGKFYAAPANLRFARAASFVPLGMAEMAFAARHYPIVFPANAQGGPLAVLGLENAHNLFVTAEGFWADDHYIPAYIRRYPFIFTQAPDGQFVLCLEAGANAIADSGDKPFFEADGKAGKVIDDALRFSGDFHAQHDFAVAFVKALAEQNLLMDNNAKAQLPGGKDLTLQGFRTVDPAKFDALPDAVYLDWRKKGWIAAVHCHLISLGHWQTLANRAAREIAAKKSA